MSGNLKMYDVFREIDTLDLVAIVQAHSIEEARQKAEKLGYGKSYRVEESEEE